MYYGKTEFVYLLHYDPQLLKSQQNLKLVQIQSNCKHQNEHFSKIDGGGAGISEIVRNTVGEKKVLVKNIISFTFPALFSTAISL